MRECPWQEPTSNSIATPVLRRSARVAIPFFSATLMVCALLAPAPAAAASNSVCAHWCLENFPPGPARGACVSQAAHDTGPCFDCGPAGANTGLCGGICCAGAAICVANACATPTPTSTQTITPTNTSTPTPSNTPTQTPTPSDTPTNTPTATPTDTATDTPTNTPTDTATDTPTSTPTATDTPTITPTAAPTDTPTITPTPSSTPTDTPTATPTEAAPVAVDDTYNNAVGNTLVLVGTTSSFPAVSFTGSVLDNDSDPDNGPSPLSVGTFDATSANGGSVSMNTDGTFTFVPKAGFTGTDTFTYTITDGVKNATATVHIGLSNVVWYVDNSGSNGSGESNAPFNDLAAPQLASQPGDIIFVYHGSSTYSGGISLKNSQQLIGQGVSLVVNGHTLVTGSFAMRPTIGNAVGFGITVASGNTVRGLNVNAQSGITGTAVGDLTTNSVAVTASDGTGVNINGGGTLAVGLDGVSANGMGSATNGIVLSNTAGSFAVAGGTIQNMTGDGIVLTNATNVSLTSMTIASNAHNGINGTAVTGLSLDSCMISNNTNNTNQAGLLLTNLAGTNSVTNTEVSGSTENNVTVANNSGTLTSLMFSNCTIRNNSNALGNVGIRVAGSNTAVMTATIDGCTFDGNRTIALQGDVADTSQLTFSATNNTFTAGTSGNPQGNQGIEVSASQSGQLTFDIEGNNVGTPDGTTPSPLGNTGIDVFAGNTSALSGKVKNNVVINAGAGVSGFGIRLFQNANSTLRANVEGNTVSNVGLDYGILADAAQNTGDPPPGAGQARMDVAVTNNDASVLSGALDAIRVQARKVNTVCAKISGNTTNSGGTGFFGLFARQANTAIFDVEGLALGAQTAAATQASLVTQNPSATTVGTSAATNFTGVASGTCNIP